MNVVGEAVFVGVLVGVLALLSIYGYTIYSAAVLHGADKYCYEVSKLINSTRACLRKGETAIIILPYPVNVQKGTCLLYTSPSPRDRG